jgi:SecD/SecF fusion protein
MWASLTRDNVGRNIAILFDGKVFGAPRVMEEIKNGECMISGNFTESELNRLKAALE